uniref:Uncharacterized protein n=1 Tax=Aegilops tauschii subsp. strangulata TaxID=200361 RepID=A0A452ZC69_AEGTS
PSPNPSRHSALTAPAPALSATAPHLQRWRPRSPPPVFRRRRGPSPSSPTTHPRPARPHPLLCTDSAGGRALHRQSAPSALAAALSTAGRSPPSRTVSSVPDHPSPSRHFLAFLPSQSLGTRSCSTEQIAHSWSLGGKLAAGSGRRSSGFCSCGELPNTPLILSFPSSPGRAAGCWTRPSSPPRAAGRWTPAAADLKLHRRRPHVADLKLHHRLRLAPLLLLRLAPLL